MEEKKDKSDDPVVDLFPDDDADDRAGKIKRRLCSPFTAFTPSSPLYLVGSEPFSLSKLTLWSHISLK